jgi:uncharacterized protein
MHDSSDMRITHLWRYPVKSLAGEALTEAELDRCGIPFDRSFQLVDERETRKGQVLTARQIPRLLSFRARAANGSVSVQSPDGSFVTAGEELATKLQSTFDHALSIVARDKDSYPFFDDNDLLVINAESVRALGLEMDIPVDIMRFRPSIVLDGEDAKAFVEDEWIGRSFAAGRAELDIVERNVRCIMTNIDPTTCAVDPSFLKFLTDHHQQCFGVYASVRRPGRIAIGDEWRPL